MVRILNEVFNFNYISYYITNLASAGIGIPSNNSTFIEYDKLMNAKRGGMIKQKNSNIFLSIFCSNEDAQNLEDCNDYVFGYVTKTTDNRYYITTEKDTLSKHDVSNKKALIKYLRLQYGYYEENYKILVKSIEFSANLAMIPLSCHEQNPKLNACDLFFPVTVALGVASLPLTISYGLVYGSIHSAVRSYKIKKFVNSIVYNNQNKVITMNPGS